MSVSGPPVVEQNDGTGGDVDTIDEEFQEAGLSAGTAAAGLVPGVGEETSAGAEVDQAHQTETTIERHVGQPTQEVQEATDPESLEDFWNRVTPDVPTVPDSPDDLVKGLSLEQQLAILFLVIVVVGVIFRPYASTAAGVTNQ